MSGDMKIAPHQTLRGISEKAQRLFSLYLRLCSPILYSQAEKILVLIFIPAAVMTSPIHSLKYF
ncbi:MAG: hypothetical protein GXO98_06820 [Nitrospirae bacterium]|nr:hypothetical protein [Nitrospirota bacterium]